MVSGKGESSKGKTFEGQIRASADKPCRLLQHFGLYCESSRLPRKRKIVKDAQLTIRLVAHSGSQEHLFGNSCY